MTSWVAYEELVKVAVTDVLTKLRKDNQPYSYCTYSINPEIFCHMLEDIAKSMINKDSEDVFVAFTKYGFDIRVQKSLKARR